MPYKTVIIGLGTIAHYHVMALKQAEQFRLCGVCDLREEAADDELFRAYPFYTDYEALLTSERPDVAVIATPPSSHYKIARDCARHGVLPIVEKPLAATQQEGALFFAGPLRGKYVPVCHTLYGPEMLWLTQHLPLKHIESIAMVLCDPYADANGKIYQRYIGLGGCWLDSAPNALSPLLRLVPELTDITVNHLRDTDSGLPYSSALAARYKDIKIDIHIAWQRGINHKQTEIDADGKHILIDHSAQTVYMDGKQVFVAEGDRLTQQYTNFYQISPERVPSEQTLQYMYNIIYANL